MLIISVPAIDFYNIISKNKIRNSILVISFIALLQIISMIFIGYIGISFYNFQIISYAFIGIFLICFVLFLVRSLAKNKEKYVWSNFKNDLKSKIKQNVFLYSAIVIFIILSLFQTNRLEDTLYYFEISSSFRFDIMPDLYTYISPASYYFYGALSDGLVTQWYYIFTPISFFIVLSGIINDYITKSFVGKYKYLQISAIIFFITLFSVFVAPTFISGNLYISSCLTGIYMLYMKDKDFKNSALVLLVAQFYSVTGLLLSCVLVISTFIYFFIYGDLRKIIKLTPWYALAIFGMPFLMLSFIGTGYGSLASFWGYLFMGLFACLIVAALVANYYFDKRKIDNKFVNFSLIQTKWFSSNVMKYIVLSISIFCIIIITVYFQTIYYQNFVYSMIPFYIFLVALLPIIIINYLNQFKLDENLNLILMMNMCIISFVSIFLWIFKIENGSIWRLMMLLPTLTIGESTIGYCILFGINLSILWPYTKSINWQWLTKFNYIKAHNGTAITLSTLTIIGSFVPSAVVAINPAMTNYVWNTYSANVGKNVNLFETNDINKMLNLSRLTAKSNWNFVFDNFSSAYITIKEIYNSSFNFYEGIFKNQGIDFVSSDGRVNPLGSLGFYKSRLISKEWKNPYIVNQSLDEFGSWLNAYINTGNWRLRNDVIFLDKNSEYYSYINLNQSNTLTYDTSIFNEITVITKDINIMNSIRNNV